MVVVAAPTPSEAMVFADLRYFLFGRFWEIVKSKDSISIICGRAVPWAPRLGLEL